MEKVHKRKDGMFLNRGDRIELSELITLGRQINNFQNFVRTLIQNRVLFLSQLRKTLNNQTTIRK